MAFSIVMPALEMAQETGKLVSWRKKEGERVSKGEALFEVETDKAVMEIESPADGILAGITVREGVVAPVGQTIAWIVQVGEQIPSEAATVIAPAGIRPEASTANLASSTPCADSGPRVSPKARRFAKERGVDLSLVRASGPEGEILTSDILAFVQAPSANGPAPVGEPFSATARLMAERTTECWKTVPHFFVTREVDAGTLVAARERLASEVQRTHGIKITYTDLLVSVIGRTLMKHPRVNGTWNKDGIRLNSHVNIAIAMAIDDGVVAPVIRIANNFGLGEIAVQRRELTQRARAGRLRPDDVGGATFTISNLGAHHVDAFSAIISPPQAAILAVGSIRDRVVPVDGKPSVRPMMTLTLSCDHRILDGAKSAAFLSDLEAAIAASDKWLR